MNLFFFLLMNKIVKEDKAHGMLIGVAYGDALGAPCEFNGKGPYVPDRIDEHWFFEKRNQYNFMVKHQAGQVTDDTELTIALIRALKRGYSKSTVVEEYHRFANSGTYSLGTNTKSLFFGYKSVKLFEKKYLKRFATSSSVMSSQSNGHMMRLSPIALLENSETRNLVAELDCMITNPSPISKRISLLYVNILNKCLKENDVAICKSMVFSLCTSEVKNDIGYCFRDAMKPVFDRDLQNQRGWNVHALSVSLWVVLHTASFHEGIKEIIKRGGDTDTNAAIGGALLGAIFGKTKMLESDVVAWNVDYIFEKTEARIESGHGSYEKCLIRHSSWHPTELLKDATGIVDIKLDNDSLRNEIEYVQSLLKDIRKRTVKDAKTIAIIGTSRSGKTSLARLTAKALKNRGYICEIIYQDMFRVPVSSYIQDRKNWEHASATNWVKLCETFHDKRSTADVCIVEGYCLMYGPAELCDGFDKIFHLDCSIELCKARRTSYPTQHRYGDRGWESVEDYVDYCIWPFHEKHETHLLSKSVSIEHLDEKNTQHANVEILCEATSVLMSS